MSTKHPSVTVSAQVEAWLALLGQTLLPSREPEKVESQLETVRAQLDLVLESEERTLVALRLQEWVEHHYELIEDASELTAVTRECNVLSWVLEPYPDLRGSVLRQSALQLLSCLQWGPSLSLLGGQIQQLKAVAKVDARCSQWLRHIEAELELLLHRPTKRPMLPH